MLQSSVSAFDRERATRYKAALDAYPTARYLEILPLLCLCSDPRLHELDIVDLGSGTGYLADIFEGLAKTVLRADKSSAMLAASGSPNIVVCDSAKPTEVLKPECADIVTCLASFHHCTIPEVPTTEREYEVAGTRHWGPERHLDIDSCLQLQYDAMRDWSRLLRPGGFIVLVDVPGYPDPAWGPYVNMNERHAVDTRGYYRNMVQEVNDWPLHVATDVLESFFRNAWRDLWFTDLHMKSVREIVTNSPSMASLVDTYRIPVEALKLRGPMVPADFFDDVVHGYGTHHHFAYFPRESSIAEAMRAAELTDVRSFTLPAPWLFDSREGAAWFVHELFGLGRAWPQNSPPRNELNKLLQWLENYLGFYTDGYGRCALYWQLSYAVGRKPS